MSQQNSVFSYLQYSREGKTIVESNIAVEAPVSLTVNGEIWLTFQCTPDDLEALALGFLFNEGFLTRMEDVANVHVCDQKDNVDVWLNYGVKKPVSWRRTSGCHGGTTSSDLKQDAFQPVTGQDRLSPEQVFSLLEAFMSNQTPHSQSGGVHTSALGDGDRILFLLHDIGRHNTFDKIAGRMLLENCVVKSPLLITTGRISSDMLQKTVRMRAPFLISMRSISQMSLNLAGEWGITAIGGARPGRFNLYTHPERIVPSPSFD